MKRNGTAIVIANDNRNRLIAETSAQLLGQCAFARCPCGRLNLDTTPAGQAKKALENNNILLAHIGIPGRQDYQESIFQFLNGYAGLTVKPATGFITHDAAHAGYVVREWLAENPRARNIIPDGRLNIIDARSPLTSATMEAALEVLSANAPPLAKPHIHAKALQPLTEVAISALSRPSFVVSI